MLCDYFKFIQGQRPIDIVIPQSSPVFLLISPPRSWMIIDESVDFWMGPGGGVAWYINNCVLLQIRSLATGEIVRWRGGGEYSQLSVADQRRQGLQFSGIFVHPTREEVNPFITTTGMGRG